VFAAKVYNDKLTPSNARYPQNKSEAESNNKAKNKKKK